MDSKLILTKVNSIRCAVLMKGNQLVAASFPDEDEKIMDGIYVARIRDVVKDLNACFAEIDKGVTCFLPGTQMQTPFYLSGIDGEIPKGRAPRQGDLLLVQGLREAQKNKRPAVTTRLSASNRFFVLIFGSSKTNFSKKLSPQRIETLKREFCTGKYFDDMGNLRPWTWVEAGECEYLDAFPPVDLILRTECGDVPIPILQKAFEELLQEFFQLLKSAFYRSPFTCLRKPPSPWQDVISRLASAEEYQELLTDDEELFQELQREELVPPGKNLRLYEDPSYPLDKLYSLSTKLEEALSARVWLKSGAYLVIEPTEALTVIDVNSGKYEARKGDQDFYRDVNLEAAKEIARQIRLRNLSGMILIDFINMKDSADQEALMLEMERLLQGDLVRSNVVDFTRLGLMEITRMKTVPTLLEQAKRFHYPIPT